MAHQPKLADLQRKIAIDLFLDLDDHALQSTLQQGLVCSFLGLSLSSAFQPIVRADGKIVGREALLRAVVIAKEEAISPQSAFAHGIEAHKLVAFDRLVRTIHLLNHANEFDEHELIFLNVHPQLLTSVSDHGRTFEQILHFYSVPTSRVVIEIRESAVKDDARLEEAVKNYRSLGYQIAIDNFGSGHTSRDDLFQQNSQYTKSAVFEGQGWLDRVLSLRPDFVKFDESVIRKVQRSTEAAFALHHLVGLFHAIGTKVVVQNIETSGQLEVARSVHADLLQGNYLGRPQIISEARGELCRSERIAA